MNSNYSKEACIESFLEAQAAESHGAKQVELCSRLDLDGCTPHLEDIKKTLHFTNLVIKVMIRPRGGSFVMTTEEISLMKDQIDQMKELQVHEVVYGMSSTDDRLDIDQIARLRDRAFPLPVTIHKAIDSSPEILEDLSKLLQLGGIKSVLTSGGQATAMEGQHMLRDMMSLTGDQIEIIPAGKITHDNVEVLHTLLQAKTYHGRRIVPLK